MKTHKSGEDNFKHVCIDCGARYQRAFALTDHIRTEHPPSEEVELDVVEEYVIEGNEPDQKEETEVYSVLM